MRFQGPDALEWIFTQEAVHGIECCASPHFHGPETNAVHFFSNGKHVLCSHPCGQQRLMPISKGVVLDFDGILLARFQKIVHKNLHL